MESSFVVAAAAYSHLFCELLGGVGWSLTSLFSTNMAISETRVTG